MGHRLPPLHPGDPARHLHQRRRGPPPRPRGVQQVPVGLWTRPLPDGPFAGQSLRDLHSGAPRPGVAALARAGAGTSGSSGVVVTDRWGRSATHDAVVVTCQSWLLSARIDTEEQLFDHPTWMAMDRSHYAQSSKTFVMVDRPFWRDRDPVTGRRVLSTTLNRPHDPRHLPARRRRRRRRRARHHLPVLHLERRRPEVAGLSTDERVRLMVRSLGEVYPGVDIASHIVGEPVTVSWESDPNFMGAFRGALPGHYRYQRRLYSHFVRDDLPPAEQGLFLAGDDISFTPGWADGAVTTALNAVWGVVRHLGGSTHPDNPGPGDAFADLAPSTWTPPSPAPP
ncbi:FAD-dependent oxidoreductase [Quadrisphaera sp. INWT6]|uniref:flavin monoamine oxidase family protein n=1 Tax=Quadrisphaera sp. INWT6 TaxID=2596917 RepID=UPI002815C1FD|nr:FAD-dependent oxidoreductase [Quadrisphaera sp. INWT6]